VTADHSLAAIRATLGAAQGTWGDRGEVAVDTGLTYVPDDPVCIRICKRGRRYDISDDGAATALAGRPAGWLEEVDRLVAEEGFNVNRRGVVFVPAVEGRDIAKLALRLAEASRTVHGALLELGERQHR
jgi:hypothetical protein